MATIRVEWVPISRFNLGWFGLDHLQLTYDPSVVPGSDIQDTWYIIEGLINTQAIGGPRLGVLGTDGFTTLTSAYNGKEGAELEAEIGTPGSRGSRILPVTTSVLGSWDQMAGYGEAIKDNQFPYYAFSFDGWVTPTINSSSVIASLLWQLKIDVNDFRPYGLRVSPGLQTYLGTPDDDNLKMPTINFTTLAGGAGNDTFTGADYTFQTDKMYGGLGNDKFNWSSGFNIIHGGDPRTPYAEDGTDVLNYAGAGTIEINAFRHSVFGKTPDYLSVFTGLGDRAGGTDWLFSIEQFLHNSKTDTIIAGEGLKIITRNIEFDLKGEEPGEGDMFDLRKLIQGIEGIQSGADQLRIKTGDTGSSKAWWVDNIEWLVATDHDDVLALTTRLLGVDAGGGNDSVDGRKVAVGGQLGPNGYDLEVDAGAGNDVVVASAGRTLIRGGAGADTFVVSAYARRPGATEIVIEEADAADRLYVPYSFFDGSLAPLDQSALLQLKGGAAIGGEVTDESLGIMIWKTQDQQVNDPDSTAGILRFAGEIFYRKDGGDLIIEIVPGRIIPNEVAVGEGETVSTFTSDPLFDNAVIVRVKNYRDGDLGLTFEAISYSEEQVIGTYGAVSRSSNWDDVARRLTNDGVLAPSIGEIALAEQRPDESTEPPAEETTGTAMSEQIDKSLSVTRQTVSGAEGDDTITGGSASDVLDGGDGADTLTGGQGDDVLDGGSGIDRMVGGAGDDSFVVADDGDLVVEVARGGLDRVTASIAYTLPEFVEDLTLAGLAIQGTGNALDNTIEGTTNTNVLTGLAGDDTLYGGGGGDVLNGNEGSDGYIYFAGEGHIRIVDDGPATDTDELILLGEAGLSGLSAYRLSSSPNDLVLDFDAGGSVTIEAFMTGGGIERIVFGDGSTMSRADLLAMSPPVVPAAPPRAVADDGILVTASQSVIPAAALLLNDSADGGLRISSVGPASTGQVALDANGDIVLSVADGTVGNVTFTYTIEANGLTSTATATISVLARAVGDSVRIIAGTPGSDTLVGSARADLFLAAGGSDTITGKAGSDTVDYSGAAHGVRVELFNFQVFEYGAGGVAGGVIAATDTLTSIENAVGSAGDDTISGSGVANVLTPGTGNDTVDGRGGADTVDYASAAHGVRVDLTARTAVEFGAGGVAGGVVAFRDGLTSIENMIGTTVADVMIGSNGANVLAPGAGSDALDGRGGLDTVDYSRSSGAVDVNLGLGRAQEYGAAGVAAGAALSTDTLSLIENVTGSAFDDVIIGNAAANVLAGGIGSDRLDGAGGVDTLDYSNATSAVVVDLAAGTVFETDHSSVTTVSAGAFILSQDQVLSFEVVAGSAYGDRIRGDDAGRSLDGNAGDDLVIGGSGSDVLTGGLGADTLTGGGGADVFVFAAAREGGDTITDFDAGLDHLQLSATNFGTATPLLSGTGGVAAITGTAAGAVLAYDSGVGELYYDADGAGVEAAIKLVTLAGAPVLQTEDILLR